MEIKGRNNQPVHQVGADLSVEEQNARLRKALGVLIHPTNVDIAIEVPWSAGILRSTAWMVIEAYRHGTSVETAPAAQVSP